MGEQPRGNSEAAKDTCKLFSNGYVSAIYDKGFMPNTKFSRAVHITKNIISIGQELIQSFYRSIHTLYQADTGGH